MYNSLSYFYFFTYITGSQEGKERGRWEDGNRQKQCNRVNSAGQTSRDRGKVEVPDNAAHHPLLLHTRPPEADSTSAVLPPRAEPTAKQPT